MVLRSLQNAKNETDDYGFQFMIILNKEFFIDFFPNSLYKSMVFLNFYVSKGFPKAVLSLVSTIIS